MSEFIGLNMHDKHTVQLRSILRLLKRLISDIDRIESNLVLTFKGSKDEYYSKKSRLSMIKKSLVKFSSRILEIPDSDYLKEEISFLGVKEKVDDVTVEDIVTYVCVNINTCINQAIFDKGRDYKYVSMDIGLMIHHWRDEVHRNLQSVRAWYLMDGIIEVPKSWN